MLAMRIEANEPLAATILTGGWEILLIVLLLTYLGETEYEIILAPCPETSNGPSIPCSLCLFNQLILDVVCF